MSKWVTPNVLEKRVRLGTLEVPEAARERVLQKYEKLKYPMNSVWNLPEANESLWETVPIDDELFKIAHYMDRNRSYRYVCVSLIAYSLPLGFITGSRLLTTLTKRPFKKLYEKRRKCW